MAGRSSSRSTALVCGVVAIASTLTFTVPALAGTVRVDGESSDRSLVYTAAAGEFNEITINLQSARYAIQDGTTGSRDTLAVEAVPPCVHTMTPPPPAVLLDAYCPSEGVTRLVVRAGDKNDSISISAMGPGAAAADIQGGDGNDTIWAANGVPDAISCGAGDDRVTADPADQLAADCEPGAPSMTPSPTPTPGPRQTAAATTIATLHGFTPVRAWNEVQAWTDYSTADKRWHVVVRRAGQISIPPAIPAGDERLKVDVGPGPSGNPALAFVSCDGVCRVVVSDPDGNGKRTVPGSERASSPTIWGSRVAWVRGEGSDGRYLPPRTVLTSRLGVSRVTRLGGSPQRKCYRPYTGGRRCERPGGTIDDLELHGSQLALIDSYALSRGGGSNGTTEVRMESVRGGPQRLIASMNVGEGQQTWIGPSWAKGNLYFYRSCPFGCPKAQGAYRYTPESGAYALAAGKYAISGFAMDQRARRAFEALGLFGDRADSGGELTTSLQLTDELNFTSTRAPIADPGAS